MVVGDPGWPFRLMTMITLMSGTAFIMWLGEQISERGIGNGISLIIFAGIVASLPSAIVTTFSYVRQGELGPLVLLLLAALMVVTIGAIIFVERGQRRIPVQYASVWWGAACTAGSRPICRSSSTPRGSSRRSSRRRY